MLFVFGLLVVTMLGGQFETSFGAVISALSNMGPALGEAGPTANFSTAFSQPARLVLAMLMIIGRLEIMAVLLMVVPVLLSVNVWTKNKRMVVKRWVGRKIHR